MAYTSWRGVVGIIKPTARPGSLEELIRILPEGIGVIPMILEACGDLESFRDAMPAFDAKIAELAAQEVDIIHAGGEPPFMLHGFAGERRIVRAWEKKFGIPVSTSGMSYAAAFRALKAKRIVIVRGTTWDTEGTVAGYYRDAGIEVLGTESIDVAWEDIGQLSAERLYTHVRRAVLNHPGVEGIYLMGSTSRGGLANVERMEQDFGVAVFHMVACQCWDIQSKLHVRQPVSGCGRLLAELP